MAIQCQKDNKMSTAPLTKFWVAVFEDGRTIIQPQDDRYSKHDDTAEWNPSAFRDVLEHQEKSELSMFSMGKVVLYLKDGLFGTDGDSLFSLEEKPLTNRKLIYYRETSRDMVDGVWQDAVIKRYAIGYEGKDPDGNVQKKVVFL